MLAVAAHTFGKSRVGANSIAQATKKAAADDHDLRNTFGGFEPTNDQASSGKDEKKKGVLVFLDHIQAASKLVEGVAQGTVITSSCGQYRYHISIIDYLQRYTCKKFGERWFKIMFKRAVPWEVSSMAPDAYGDRFEAYMKATVFNRRM